MENKKERSVYVVILAGGSGERMQSRIPKQFLKLGKRTILQATVEQFVEACPQARILTVLPQAHMQTWKDICTDSMAYCPQMLIPGGPTRFHSVRNALAKIPDGEIVVIHDGVRPFVSVKLIRDMLAEMQKCRALIPVLPISDTLRWKDSSRSGPDRGSLLAVQTPQMFLSEDLKKAYGQAYKTSFTDDASVAQEAGIEICCFPGEKRNIKITTPEDLCLGKALAEASLDPNLADEGLVQ